MNLMPEIVDRIVFAMEDQSTDYSMAVDTADMIKDQGARLGDRFIPIPPWRPLDGFQLMEQFVAELRNPIHRERLQTALSSRGRVFRAFKDEIKRSSYIEQLWYRFKLREMRRVVTEWYDAERRSRGLAQIDPEPEEIDDLLASEFVFDQAQACDIVHLARLQEELRTDLCTQWRATSAEDSNEIVVVARCSHPGIVGFIAGCLSADGFVSIEDLAVTPEFQSIGVGRSLLAHFIDLAERRSVHAINVDLSGSAQSLTALFIQQGFSVVAQTLQLTFGSMAGLTPELAASRTCADVAPGPAHPPRS